jgi:hypothetical protein
MLKKMLYGSCFLFFKLFSPLVPPETIATYTERGIIIPPNLTVKQSTLDYLTNASTLKSLGDRDVLANTEITSEALLKKTIFRMSSGSFTDAEKAELKRYNIVFGKTSDPTASEDETLLSDAATTKKIVSAFNRLKEVSPLTPGEPREKIIIDISHLDPSEVLHQAADKKALTSEEALSAQEKRATDADEEQKKAVPKVQPVKVTRPIIDTELKARLNEHLLVLKDEFNAQLARATTSEEKARLIATHNNLRKAARTITDASLLRQRTSEQAQAAVDRSNGDTSSLLKALESTADKRTSSDSDRAEVADRYKRAVASAAIQLEEKEQEKAAASETSGSPQKDSAVRFDELLEADDAQKMDRELTNQEKAEIINKLKQKLSDSDSPAQQAQNRAIIRQARLKMDSRILARIASEDVAAKAAAMEREEGARAKPTTSPQTTFTAHSPTAAKPPASGKKWGTSSPRR